MKIHDIRKIGKFEFTNSPEDQKRMHEYLRSIGIEPSNLYQELEMSSSFVNTHRDTSYGNAKISLHSHSYYEIIYCRSCAGVEYLVGSNRYRLQNGDIICVPPGISHRPILPEKMTQPYVRDMLWVSTYFLNWMADMLSNEEWKNGHLSEPVRTGGTRWEFIGELFRVGIEEEEQKRPGWELAVMGNTLQIFANLKRAYLERSAGSMKAEKPELPDRITDYVDKYYTEHITVDDLARQFYVSNSTISHLFKQKMGVSVYRYITQRRLIAAKTLIGEKMPMEEIAHRIGFADYSSFYRAFKQEFGISPRQFSQIR